MNSDSISLMIIVVSIVMSAYFSATETAFFSLNRIRIKNMAEEGDEFVYGGYRVTVLEMNGRRVEKIRIEAFSRQDT